MSAFGTKPTSRWARSMSALRGKADIALTSGRSPIDPKRTWPPRADQIHRLNESLRIRLICFGWDGTERWITPRLTAFYRVQVVARPCASYRQHGRTAAVSANCKHSSAGRAVSRSPQSKCCCNFQSYCQPDFIARACLPPPARLPGSTLRGRPRFSVMPCQDGHRSAPRVVAAFACLVHERQSAADYDHNHDGDGQ